MIWRHGQTQRSTGADAASGRRIRFAAGAALVLLVLAFGTASRTFAAFGAPAHLSNTLAADTPSTAQGSTANGVAGLSVADVAAEVNPAVVTVTNVAAVSDRTQAILGPGAQLVATGSGFFIDDQGHVMTNSHVVDGASKLSVTLADGTTLDATLVGQDQFQDIAVLQVKLPQGQKAPAVAQFGDASTLRPGDPVVALGTPLGEFPNSVTDGVVGGLDRSLDTGQGYFLPNLIQHDAPISPGNSGGPLVDMSGKVIGVNVAKASDGANGTSGIEGIEFAISIDAAKDIADQLIATGHVARPYFGVSGEPTADGQGIVEVTSDGPAAKAGLKPGDVVTAIDGTPIDPDHPFVNELFSHKPGDTVDLTIERDGASRDVSVKLGERPADVQ